MALIRSKIMYAAASWTPWIGKGDCKALEKVQREAGRIATGLMKTTPVVAAMVEAG